MFLNGTDLLYHCIYCSTKQAIQLYTQTILIHSTQTNSILYTQTNSILHATCTNLILLKWTQFYCILLKSSQSDMFSNLQP